MRELMAKYADVELLVKIGEYKSGSDAVTDEAIAKIETIRSFLKQRTKDLSSLEEAVNNLCQITNMPAPAVRQAA
jgi:type III secretion protein N (ATPase)